jgi:acetylornithine deacetylase/succinyl-diaminopimelate desuccinylase-like protein
MRHFANRGIPCVMFGTPGLERAHAANEYADVADTLRIARTIVRVLLRWGRTDAD